MLRLIVLAGLAALAVLEVATVIALSNTLGAGGALVVLGLDVVLGVLLMRWAVRSRPPQRGWRLAAGMIVALPGLVLDAVALVLLVPRVQQFVRERVLRGTESILRQQGVSVVTVSDPAGRHRVVRGDVVDGDQADARGDDGSQAGPAGQHHEDEDRAPGGRPGPRIVRGEIADG
jgi:UPF0716 family protein affecting phage T7 exclusion